MDPVHSENGTIREAVSCILLKRFENSTYTRNFYIFDQYELHSAGQEKENIEQKIRGNNPNNDPVRSQSLYDLFLRSHVFSGLRAFVCLTAGNTAHPKYRRYAQLFFRIDHFQIADVFAGEFSPGKISAENIPE